MSKNIISLNSINLYLKALADYNTSLSNKYKYKLAVTEIKKKSLFSRETILDFLYLDAEDKFNGLSYNSKVIELNNWDTVVNNFISKINNLAMNEYISNHNLDIVYNQEICKTFESALSEDNEDFKYLNNTDTIQSNVASELCRLLLKYNHVAPYRVYAIQNHPNFYLDKIYSYILFEYNHKFILLSSIIYE